MISVRWDKAQILGESHLDVELTEDFDLWSALEMMDRQIGSHNHGNACFVASWDMNDSGVAQDSDEEKKSANDRAEAQKDSGRARTRGKTAAAAKASKHGKARGVAQYAVSGSANNKTGKDLDQVSQEKEVHTLGSDEPAPELSKQPKSKGSAITKAKTKDGQNVGELEKRKRLDSNIEVVLQSAIESTGGKRKGGGNARRIGGEGHHHPSEATDDESDEGEVVEEDEEEDNDDEFAPQGKSMVLASREESDARPRVKRPRLAKERA